MPWVPRDERLADELPLLAPDRDVLEVRVVAREPAGSGDRLVERRVDATRLRVHDRRQRVHVGALELRQRAVLEQQAPDRVAGDRLERGCVRGIETGTGLLRPRDPADLVQLELVEEDDAELLRRVDVERLAGELADPAP